MSRDDDFDEVMDLPNKTGAGQDDTSEPLSEDESEEEVETVSPEAEEKEMPARPRKSTAKKKKKAVD